MRDGNQVSAKVSVGYPPWLFLPVGCFPALLFAARAGTATDTVQRVIWWLGCAVVLAIVGCAVFSRIVVTGTRLGVPHNIFGRRAVTLDRLTRITATLRTDAGSKQETGSRGWAIVLDDADGRSIRFGLDGVRAADRERLLRIVSHYVNETMAEKVGPVDEVFALNPWFPAPRATSRGR